MFKFSNLFILPKIVKYLRLIFSKPVSYNLLKSTHSWRFIKNVEYQIETRTIYRSLWFCSSCNSEIEVPLGLSGTNLNGPFFNKYISTVYDISPDCDVQIFRSIHSS